MFDTRIAVEEVIADLTAEEVAELNAWHDECDAREDEREERESLYSTISDLSKDILGFRARFSYQLMSLEDLRAIYHEWLDTYNSHMVDYYDEKWSRQTLDYLDEDYYDGVIMDDLAIPDQWDDLYRQKGW